MAKPSLVTVNAVLATFLPGASLLLDGRNRLRMRFQQHGSFPLLLRASDRLWFANHRGVSRSVGFGGTTEQAICQLVLWLRDQPRRPIRWWEAARSHGLGSEATLFLLRNHGYDDPAKTGCVLCGAVNPVDWWSLDGMVGPCCMYARGCREKH